MKKNTFHLNFVKPSKTIQAVFFILVLTSSLFAADYFLAHGETLTESFLSGVQIMSLRDIGNTNPTTSTISGTATPNVELEITVNDPDANFNLNGINVVFASATSTTSDCDKATIELQETGDDTGVFTGIITLSSSPTAGTNLEASTDDEYKLFYKPNSEANFVNEVHENDSGATSSFDIGETIYRDNDDCKTVSPGDTRVANAATAGFANGSIVSAGDADVGTDLILFDDDELHRRFAPGNVFDLLETVYRDNDDSGSPSVGDTRLYGAVFTGGPYVDGSVVAPGDIDIGVTLDNFFSPDFTNPGLDLGLPRVQVTVDLNTAGDVTIADDFFTADELASLSIYEPATHAVDISFSNGATQTGGTDLEVVFSTANAIIPAGSVESDLEMFYKQPGQDWEGLDEGFISVFDSGASTVTSVSIIVGDVTVGKFALGIDLDGAPGGGGGGLVRPGLVVNALAGISAIAAGGGGGPPGPTVTLGAVALSDSGSETISMPQEIRDIALNHDPYTPLEPIADIYEDFDFPLSINGNGFVLGGYENTLQTQTIELGEPTEFNIVYYTNSEIAHTSLYFNLGPTRTIAGSDTQVLLYKDKPVEIIDPNGNIASATGSLNNEGELKRVATFSITFSETAELPNPDMVIRSWNDQLSSGDTIVYDAIAIAQPEIVEIADEDIPEPEIQTLKSQYVPIWIKNNAAWWSQELIEDSDFVAGIEYLIQQEIILISDSGDVTNTSNEIPSWIKNNAGWWSEDLITEKEFIDGLQWLVSNGIIQVTET